MPGREDFSQPGTQGSGQTVAVTERPEVDVISSNQTADLTSGSTQVTEIYAPVGAIYKVRSALLDAPAIGAATSGTHSFLVTSAGAGGYVTEGVGGYNARPRFNTSMWRGTSTARPGNEAAALIAFQALEATENQPIKVEYRNNTDATQTKTRQIEFVFEEVSY